MKLFNIHEQELAFDPFGEWVKSKVKRRIEKGDSRLKTLIRGTGFTMEHVKFAIKNGECLRNPKPGEKALGPTYLEQTISNILRDLATDAEIPVGKLNDARAYFGLDKLGHKDLQKEKPMF
jgi:hypothetical protein